MKAEPIRLTTRYPSVAKMAKTLGASAHEVEEAKRLVLRAVKLRKPLSVKLAKPRKAAAAKRAARGGGR